MAADISMEGRATGQHHLGFGGCVGRGGSVKDAAWEFVKGSTVGSLTGTRAHCVRQGSGVRHTGQRVTPTDRVRWNVDQGQAKG